MIMAEKDLKHLSYFRSFHRRYHLDCRGIKSVLQLREAIDLRVF